MNSRFVFFALLIQLSIPCSLLGIEFELFSLSYGGENDDLKVNVLSRTIYDEQAAKKEIEELKNIKELKKQVKEAMHETDQKQGAIDQESNKIQQEIQITDQKINQVELSTKQIDKNIEIKRAALIKAIKEL